MSDATHPPRITVVGDLILDRYLIGDATKLNPEMPGVVIRVNKEEDRLGGAAAVAMIAAGFGAKVTLAGVLGRDEPGRSLHKLIEQHGIEPHLWIDDRPTTWKQRIVARGQLRPDRCDREVIMPTTDRAAQFLAEVPLGEILLVSDYGKGVCTSSLLKSIRSQAREAHVPIIVDPSHSRKWSDYGQVYLIKANRTEATEAARAAGFGQLHPLALARNLSDAHRCNVVVTLGPHGMVCAELSGATSYLPATSTEARDVCGAGDTILATLGVELVHHQPLRSACRTATLAAARQVQQIGVAGSVAPMLNH